MTGNTGFAVPMDRQLVVVRLAKDTLMEGEIFLESISDGLSTHQKMSGFLEGGTDFFPLKAMPAGTTEFIHKNALQSVDITLPENPEETYFSGLLLHTIPVTLYFSDGDSISGNLMAEVPREKARLSDCLNLSDAFLSIRAGNKVSYVNKDAIRKVVHAAQ